MAKLKWTVQKDEDGAFVRRKVESDRLDLDHIDVEWTHENGFKPDTILAPVHKFHPETGVTRTFEEMEVGEPREVVKDQVSVKVGTADSVIAMMLDEKRARLAQALGVEP